jgi:hypothetical protein
MSKLPLEDGDHVGLKVAALFLGCAPDGSVSVNSTKLDARSLFVMVRKGGGAWAFQNPKTKKYLTTLDDGTVRCAGDVPLARQTFLVEGLDPRRVLLKNQHSGTYLSSDIDEGVMIVSCKERAFDEQVHYFEIARE